MTTLDAIKLLPIDDTLKTQLLNMYDHLDSAQKLTIQRLAWNHYDTTYGQKIEVNLEQQHEKVSKGEEQFGQDFYARAVKKAGHEMTTTAQSSLTQVDLEAARKAMKQIVGEIRAAKDAKKAAKTK